MCNHENKVIGACKTTNHCRFAGMLVCVDVCASFNEILNENNGGAATTQWWCAREGIGPGPSDGGEPQHQLRDLCFGDS